MANRSWPNQKLFTPHVMPCMVECKFTVASSDSGGLGITNLKGSSFVQNVFMHTSATPGTGNNSIVNPNPASGTIIVQLSDNYNKLYSFGWAASPPLGSNLKVDASDAALTIGVAYSVTIVGDATKADWLALGVPPGIAGNVQVGTTFIAAATGHGTASVTRVAPSAAAGSGIFAIEMLPGAEGDIAPDPTANQGFGAQFILQCRDDSSGDASQIAAPADGSIIRLWFYLDNSSVVTDVAGLTATAV